jgi:hypothetical protein
MEFRTVTVAAPPGNGLISMPLRIGFTMFGLTVWN